MELITYLMDFVLHVDRHIGVFVQTHGVWVYALLFAIVFVETGVVVMPFLPGDSLLFITGALCGADLMSLPLALGVLLAAAILGDQCNFSIGRRVGVRVFAWENARWFNRRAFDQAHAFISPTAPSRWCWRASCPLCEPLRHLWRAWPTWTAPVSLCSMWWAR